MAANRAMALAARDVLCGRLDIPAPAPDSMIGSMAAVPLPTARPGLAGRLRRQGMVTAISPWPTPDAAVLRVSAQLSVTLDPFARLADAILAD